jgi:predicted ATPase/DNA-binding SARP family transcriptional activator
MTAVDGTPPRIQIGVLGPFTLNVNGSNQPMTAPKERGALALMAMRNGKIVSVSDLIASLWGDDPPSSAHKALQVYISHLRQRLPTGVIETTSPGYCAKFDAKDVDAIRFEGLLRNADDHNDHIRRANTILEALNLWRGPALTDLADHELGRNEANRLTELRLTAEERRFEALMLSGHDHHLVADLMTAVDVAPLREERWIQLMLALYRSGRQADALATYRKLQQHLDCELGLEPSARVRSLEEAILLNRPELDLQSPVGLSTPIHTASLTSNRKTVGNLREETSTFIGRPDVVSSIEEKLTTHQLVTLTGTAGVGKTRTALRLGTQYADRFDGGTWFTDLAPVTNAKESLLALAAVLGVQAGAGLMLMEQLIAAIGDRQVLLIVDNCEQVLEGIARIVDELVGSCPQLRVIATSRQALKLPGECVVRLHPLSLPEDDHSPVSALEDNSEAVRLFVDKVNTRIRPFTLTGENAPSVIKICRLLDGVPLAIELAAATLGSMSTGDLADRLDSRLHILSHNKVATTLHHRSLRASIEWSFQLLNANERGVFISCGVFVGGWSLRAAEEVCANEGRSRADVIEALAALVEKCLIDVDTSTSECRYSMLETIGTFAKEKGLAKGPRHLRGLHAAHAEVYAQLVRSPEEGRDPSVWHHRIDVDLLNIKAAIDFFSGTGNDDAALLIAVGMRNYWPGRAAEGKLVLERVLGGPLHGVEPSLEARAWLVSGELRYISGTRDAEQAMEQAQELALTTQDPALLSDILSSHASILAFRGQYVAGAKLADEACGWARSAGDVLLMAKALSAAGAAEVATDPAVAHCHFAEALDLFLVADDQWGVSNCLCNLGLIDIQRSSIETGLARLQQALNLATQAQLRSLGCWISCYLGYAALWRADPEVAATQFGASMSNALALGTNQILPHLIAGAAMIATSHEQYERSATLHQAAERLRRIAGESWHPFEKGLIETDTQRLAVALGSEKMERATLDSQGFLLRDTIALAEETLCS